MIEAYTPADILEAVLREAGPQLVLVGGQALAYWMNRYGVEMTMDLPAVTRDVDFLVADAGDHGPVLRMARVLRGTATFPPEHALTAIVGQAIRQVSESEYLNVDLLSKVYGLDEDAVRNAAMEALSGAFAFRVMHPIDVLASRLHNLYGLDNKQNELGALQLKSAISVVRAAHREVAASDTDTSGRPKLLGWAKSLEKMAKNDAGRKVVNRYGIHVADAIEAEVIEHENFRAKKLPRLLPLMSLPRAQEVANLIVAYPVPGGT